MSQWKNRIPGGRAWVVLLLLLGVAVTGTLLQLQAAQQTNAPAADSQKKSAAAAAPGADFRSVLVPGGGAGTELETLKNRQKYYLSRYTYPLGYYDPQWLLDAQKQVSTMSEGIPAGRVVYNRANTESPLALDPNAMVSLGPKPGQSNNCFGCYHSGLVSGRINSIAIDPIAPNIVYLGVSNGGVWKTTNCCSAATTWASVTDDPTLSTITIDEVTIDPTDHDILYAATGDFRFVGAARGSQGILKSTDAGATWSVLGESVFVPNNFDPNPFAFDPYQAVSAVKVDPNNNQTLIAGTETHLRMSYDGGVNWTAPCTTNAFSNQGQVNTEIVVRDDGATSTIFYAVGWPFDNANGANGIYTATMPSSGCPTWNLITTGVNGWPAGTGDGTPASAKPGRIDIAIAPSNPQVMYAGVSDAFFYDILGIWRSTNGGATWSQRTDYLNFQECNGGGPGSASYGQAYYDQAIDVDPNNPDVLYYGEVDAFRSTDGGATWQNVGCVYSGPDTAFGQQAYIHPDQHDFRYLPGSSSQVLFANDGGIWFTNDANVAPPTLPTIISLNAMMNTMEFYNGDITGNFATAAQPGANGGTQDNGSFVNTWTNPAALAAEEWQLRVGGDGFFAAIEPVNNQIYYQSNNNSRIWRSTTGGYSTYTEVSPAGPWSGDGRAFAMPFEIYKHNCPGTGCTHLIAGTYRVWETVNGAANSAGWYINSPTLTKVTPPNGWSSDPNILQLSYAPSLSTTAIVGTSDGNVQYGFGLGQGVANTATWVDVTDANAVLPNRPILDVTIDPVNPLMGYAALGAFDESTPGQPGHVYQVTCTAGCASQTWVNKTGNLPNLPADAIMVNPNYRQQVFVGTDSGLFYTNDIDAVSPVWVHFTSGLPNVWIADLTVDRGFTTLAVWTRNRGLYAWPLPSGPFGGPTSTPVPATSTSTGTSVPATSTNTSIPATSTSTSVPATSTSTSVPATSTSTSVPATSTSTSVPATSTNTSVPATSTNTAQVSASATATVCTTAVNLVLDDGTVEDSVGWTNSTQSFAAIWINRSSPPPSSFPMNLTQLSIKWPNSSALVGKTIALLVYVDADGDGNPTDAVKVAQVSGQTISVADGVTFQNYPVNVNIGGPGDVYYGFSDTYNSGGVSPRTFPAPLDTTATQGRSFVAAQDDASSVDYDNLGNNDNLDTIDDLSGGGLTGNWVIRASGTGGACPTSTATVPACTIQFQDAGPGTPFYEFIRCLACRNVLGGYSGAANCPGGSPCFKPNDNVTRGQIAKIVSNAAGYNDAIPSSQQSFADVPSSNTFWLFIERVYTHGAISGYMCDGTNGEPTSGACYRPGNNLTRGQLAKIATSVAGYSETPSGQTFKDVPPSSTFYVFIERAALHGIISGYPCGAPGEPCPGSYFRPGVNVTRGQAAKIIAGTFFPNCVTP